MFDNYKGARTAKRPRWVGALISFSILLHAGLLVGLVVQSIWMIDKLAVPEAQLELSFGAPPPPPPPKGGGKKQDTLKDKIKKIKVKDAVQPVMDAETPDPDEVTDEAEEEDFGVEGGVEGGVAGGVLGGVLGGTVGGAGPPPPPAPEKPRIVPAQLLRANRIAGNDQILPPDQVKGLMVKQGESKLIANARLCLDDGGRVTKVEMIKSSGYSEYDQRILGEMRAWKYRPHTVNGKPVPVCTAVTFIYRQQG